MKLRRLLIMLVLCVVAAQGSSASASVPGSAGRIAFTSNRDTAEASELYSAAPDGTDVKRLTWSDATEQESAWSPDGSRIAYERSYQGRFRIFVMNNDGSDAHLLSPDVGSSVDDTEPAWSPDGTKLAFASTRPTGSAWHVWIMNADGTNPRQLPGDLIQHPAWSPDGARIAGEDGNGPLYVVNSDGTNQRRLTTPPALHYDESPDWSPDGSSLVFSERSSDGRQSALYRIGADGSGQRQLTSGTDADYRPSWSPAGTRIVFDRRAATTESFHVFVVDSEGGPAAQLISSNRDDMGAAWGTSTVSPTVDPPAAPDIDIQIYSPVAGNLYLPGTSEPVFYLCNPDTPTTIIISCVGSQPLFDSIDTSFAGEHEFTVTATDLDGRQATATVTYTVPDFTPPSIQLRAPVDAAGYDLGSSVTVDYACDDGHGSGIQFCNGTLPSGAPLDTTQPGTFTFEVAALDNANHLATTTVTYSVVDPAPPEPNIASPTARAVYMQGQFVAADYTCPGSRITSCVGSVSSGSAIDTATVGDHTFTVTASRGHATATTSHAYTVIYDFSGFFAPVVSLPATNAVKAGEGVPVKFSLGGDRGSNVFAVGSPAWSPCDAPTDSTTASGRLTYNASLGRYTFLATTDRSWAGSCEDLMVTLRDGTTRRARFTFR